MPVTPKDKRAESIRKKSSADTEKGQRPVAKDTNKTRRKQTLLPLKNAVRKKTKP